MNVSVAGVGKAALPASTNVPLSKREIARVERDRERGYSINAKQIVLAFVVEFVIIGLILTNTYVTVAQLPDQSTFKIVQALLFPVAMAMVELARVPLAVAVRTQPSWNIKFAALIGVLCAVAVTSNSLYAIGASSFSPRLEDTHRKDSSVTVLKERKKEIESQIGNARADVAQKLKDRDAINSSIQSLNQQLTAQSPQTCNVVTVPSPAPGVPSSTRQDCRVNPVLRTLNSEIAANKLKLSDAETAVKTTQGVIDRLVASSELKVVIDELSRAESDNRELIFQSQLHSLAAMLFGVDPREVTPGQIKTLEFYLIFVSSIAAAFSSTLIAMTAVRRIRTSRTQVPIDIPDEAAAYLFGPLIMAIRKETQEAIATISKEAASQPQRNAGLTS